MSKLESIVNKLKDTGYRLYNDLNRREFRVAETDYANVLTQNADEFKRLYFEESDVLLVKNFMSADEVAAFHARVMTHQPKVVDHKRFGPMYGATLIESKEDLKEYFDKAEIFAKELDYLLGFDFNARFSNFFSKLAGGTALELPEKDGRKYVPATIKFMQPGQGALPVHVGLEFYVLYPELSHLYSLIYGTAQISYFVVLEYPDEGGEITLYDIRYPQPANERFKNRDGKIHHIRTRPAQRIKPAVGTMFIFNGGQIWHKIEDFYGKGQRVTLAGFLNYSKDLKTIYYWS